MIAINYYKFSCTVGEGGGEVGRTELRTLLRLELFRSLEVTEDIGGGGWVRLESAAATPNGGGSGLLSAIWVTGEPRLVRLAAAAEARYWQTASAAYSSSSALIKME